MKKLICFPVAFGISMLMFIAATLFIRLNTGLVQPELPAKFFMIAVQAVCALKFGLLLIVLMPQKPALTQLALGFVLADLFMLFAGVMLDGSLATPAALFAVQALFLIYQMALQGRLWIYKSDTSSIKVNNKLVTPPYLKSYRYEQ